ncbi:hypothetical protein LOK46_13445 [Methylobacterium sp. NMS14P]|uniref:hypothetical protein n=1 Tax=Methylobacterium sp. NMS14P TaxID=2894310 RepID=UPI002359D169|nr:hypothetical protein [Methylobacterium sp. NMS14P]WCS27779.1 hypothetical protein LOK46_13445 [Methylobacterium sp. NMS14P]
MALKLADRVKETTVTEGTGDIALAGAVNGFSSFSSRLSTGDITFYAIMLGVQWEVGLGTLTAATTLQRTTVLASSNADALVPFTAGTKEVFVDFPAVLANRLSDFAISEATVASAATVDLGAQNSRKVAISGTAAITSFGTFAHGEKLLRFTGACTLTHNATSLVLPTGTNIVTAAGDTALATSDASGNWRVRHYQRADGSPVRGAYLGAPVAVTASGSIPATGIGLKYRASGAGGYTRTLPAISSVFTGWATDVIENNSTGILIIAANGTDPFEGISGGSFKLLPKQRAYVYLDTDGWHVGWVDRSPIVSSALITTAVTSVDLLLPAGYDKFEFAVDGLKVDTQGASFGARLSSDGGSNFKAGTNDYYGMYVYGNNNSNTPAVYYFGANYLEIANAVSTGTTTPLSARGTIYPGDAATQAMMLFNSAAPWSSGLFRVSNYAQVYNGGSNALMNAIRFMTTTGKATAGSIVIRGTPAT